MNQMMLLAVATSPEAGGDALPFLILGLWILLLAIFVGFELITKVPPTIHTPLMSGANAISGITIVGALYCASAGYGTLGQILGFLAITFATINVVGGFLVTDRMLKMFGQKGGKR
jgi:NAD(P) transhydrogenase subunit alpha